MCNYSLVISLFFFTISIDIIYSQFFNLSALQQYVRFIQHVVVTRRANQRWFAYCAVHQVTMSTPRMTTSKTIYNYFLPSCATQTPPSTGGVLDCLQFFISCLPCDPPFFKNLFLEGGVPVRVGQKYTLVMSCCSCLGRLICCLVADNPSVIRNTAQFHSFWVQNIMHLMLDSAGYGVIRISIGQ